MCNIRTVLTLIVAVMAIAAFPVLTMASPSYSDAVPSSNATVEDADPGDNPAVRVDEVSLLRNRSCPPQASNTGSTDAERFRRQNEQTPLDLEKQTQPPVVAPAPVVTHSGPPTWVIVLLGVLGTVAVVVCFVLGVLSQWRRTHPRA